MGENREYITITTDKGNVNVSVDVISVVAARAVTGTEGVAGLAWESTDIFGKKNVSKGVRLSFADDDSVGVEVYFLAKMGVSVHKIAADVQKNVISDVETVTGVKVNEVNVHVVGIDLK